MDYEEDLNAKDDAYEKFQIRATFIPTIKKVKIKDKSIDVDFLSDFCRSLFEMHVVINKAANHRYIKPNFFDFLLNLVIKFFPHS